jgi:hypothetical protein
MRQMAATLVAAMALAAGWAWPAAAQRPATAPATDCPIQTAPGRFPYRASSAASPGNDGITPAGFVAVQGFQVLHGVDASKWQRSADFNRVKACGGSFAYIRLTAGRRPDLEIEYRSHWSAARAAGLVAGPYHALTLVDPPAAWTTLSAAEKAANLATNLASATDQAKLFIERLREVLLLEQRSATTTAGNALGAPYLPIMLAAALRPQSQGSRADRAGFGEVYRQLICRWYQVVNADPAFAGQAMGFFSTAFIFQDYGLASAPCDMANRPAWIGHHLLNGDTERRETDPQSGAAIRAMCLKPDGSNRCLFQQYTAFGSFASYSETEGLDLNRFYGDQPAFDRLLQTGRR